MSAPPTAPPPGYEPDFFERMGETMVSLVSNSYSFGLNMQKKTGQFFGHYLIRCVYVRLYSSTHTYSISNLDFFGPEFMIFVPLQRKKGFKVYAKSKKM